MLTVYYRRLIVNGDSSPKNKIHLIIGVYPVYLPKESAVFILKFLMAEITDTSKQRISHILNL